MNDEAKIRRTEEAILALEQVPTHGCVKDSLAMILAAGQALPEDWVKPCPGETFQWVRCRLRFSQEELAIKSGLARSQITRLEANAEAFLSTWARAYRAMGFDLVLLPVSKKTVKELEKDAEAGRSPRHWGLSPARPRRRYPKPGPSSSAGP